MKKFKSVDYDLESEDYYLLPKRYKSTLHRSRSLTSFIGKTISGGALLLLAGIAGSMYFAFKILASF